MLRPCEVSLGKAKHLRSVPAMGRTVDVTLCVCGYQNRFYRWSWAGHGKARCAGCTAWIDYRDLEVFKKA